MIVAPAYRIAAMTAAGWWGDVTFDALLRRRIAEHGDAEALVDPPDLPALTGCAARRLSWREIGEAVDRLAAVLTAHGVARDQVVVIQLPNIAALSIAYLACARLGIIASPAPVQYREHELAHIVAKTDAVAAIGAARIGADHPATRFAGLREALPTLRHVFAVGGAAGAGTIDLDAACAAATASPAAAAITANDVVTICWTSGTEAEPKGVPRSHNDWLIMGQGVIDAAGLQPGARLLNPFPMVNMAGLSTCVAGWLLLGATLVQHQPFDLAIFLNQLREEAIDYTVAPPAVLNLLLRDEQLMAGVDFTRLRSIGSGSAPLSAQMVRGFQDRYGVDIVNYFGSNEGASLSSSRRDMPDPERRATLFPHPRDGRMALRLVEPDGGRVIERAGEAGELRIKGPTVFAGYWRAPELDAAAFDEACWFRTGDLFEYADDDRRFLRLVGRLKDIVVRGGVKISSEELEAQLLAHPAIAEAAVVGMPDPRLGERIAAFVVFADGRSVSLPALNAFLIAERRLAVFKQVERLEPVAALPRNPVGKVLKRTLRQTLVQTETA